MIVGAAFVLAMAMVPKFVSSYFVTVFIVLFANIALATAWSFFSGPTRYVSLATAAFFGVGVYAVAILHAYLPIPLALLAALVAGFVVALIVGLSTLRLRGVYFVIFTFGLTELIHQVLVWWEVNQNKTVSRYIFAGVPGTTIFEILLGVAVFTVVGSWLVSRTRFGLALAAIGEDETVARHTGVNTTAIKVVAFAISGAIMSLVGAVLALRYPYVDPSIAFNSTWSFQVMIAALLGGPSRPWGPAIGAIPLILLSEYLAGTFPHHFSIALGLCFVVIVYFLPGGIAPLLERVMQKLRNALKARRAPSLKAGS